MPYLVTQYGEQDSDWSLSRHTVWRIGFRQVSYLVTQYGGQDSDRCLISSHTMEGRIPTGALSRHTVWRAGFRQVPYLVTQYGGQDSDRCLISSHSMEGRIPTGPDHVNCEPAGPKSPNTHRPCSNPNNLRF